MAKDMMTDSDVEMEIERLKESEAVKLAQKERQFKYRRRQYLYTLRWYEKRGNELIAQGKTMADFDVSKIEQEDVLDSEEGGEHIASGRRTVN